VQASARKALDGIEAGGTKEAFPPTIGNPGKNEIAKDVEQVHFCIGTDGCSYFEDDRFTAIVMDGVLGSGMSSRLFQEVREKRGLAYAIGSYELTYSSGGAFTVYGGTSAQKWGDVQAVVRDEFEKIAKNGADEAEMGRTKRSLSGTIVLALEGMSARMMRLAKNEIVFGRDVPVEEVLRKIDAVTNDQLVEYASKVLREDRISTTAIGPFK
jgi:predicted Zn-dependent peptidase